MPFLFGENMNYLEEIKKIEELIAFKKSRLFQLKNVGFFKLGDQTMSQKYAIQEAKRRRKEISDLREKLLQLKHEYSRNNNQ